MTQIIANMQAQMNQAPPQPLDVDRAARIGWAELAAELSASGEAARQRFAGLSRNRPSGLRFGCGLDGKQEREARTHLGVRWGETEVGTRRATARGGADGGSSLRRDIPSETEGEKRGKEGLGGSHPLVELRRRMKALGSRRNDGVTSDSELRAPKAVG